MIASYHKKEGCMKNIQISFDENLLDIVNNYAASVRLSRSAVVREALKQWLRDKEIQGFENDWIRKLKEHPDDTPDNTKDSEAWIRAEQWGD